jgi:hypothetical protein
MTTTTGVTFVQAAELLAAHLADHVVPEPVILTLTTQWGRSEVAAQLRPNTVPQLATALLTWIDTLAVITMTAWRPPEGDRVHLIPRQHPDRPGRCCRAECVWRRER